VNCRPFFATLYRFDTRNTQRVFAVVMRVFKPSYASLFSTVSTNTAKLERLLQIKQRQKEEAMHIEDVERLVTEIEMLKFVLFLVCRNRIKAR
jgi:uncharacterized protein YqiB (DUF1249 family)